MMVAGDFVRYQSESSVGERCRAQMRAESNSSDFRVCVSIKSLEMPHRKSLPNVDEGSLISCQRLASLDFMLEGYDSGSECTMRKVGQKLSLTEPASKRKAQNRAAQRSFRERKERYLRKLEGRIADLERDCRVKNHENEDLRKRVHSLQRKLSFQSLSHTPPGLHTPPLVPTPESIVNEPTPPADFPDPFLLDSCGPVNNLVPVVSIVGLEALQTDDYQGFIEALQSCPLTPSKMNDELAREKVFNHLVSANRRTCGMKYTVIPATNG